MDLWLTHRVLLMWAGFVQPPAKGTLVLGPMLTIILDGLPFTTPADILLETSPFRTYLAHAEANSWNMEILLLQTWCQCSFLWCSRRICQGI